MPDAIVRQFSKEIATIASNPEFCEDFRAATQVDPSPSTSAELLKSIEADKTLYGGIAKRIGYEAR